MTLLPPPPPKSERPRESSGLPPGYQHQLDLVVQILKDRPNRYDKPRISDSQRPPITTPPDEISTGHSHLTAEGLRDDKYTRSRRLVEDELDLLKHRNPYAYRVIDEYFSVDSGHGDLDFLAAQAQKYEGSKKTYDTLQMALYILTSRLLDKKLYAKKPARLDTRTNRRRTMEEQYAEIDRVFRSWCDDLSKTYKRYRSKAYDNTALQMDVARSTVERAVRFMEKQREDEDAA